MPFSLGFWAAAGAGGGGGGAMELISTTLLSSSTSEITLSLIPGTYRHLQLRFTLRGDTAFTGYTNLDFRLNGDSSSIYSYHSLYGDGTSVTSNGFGTQPQMRDPDGTVMGGNTSGAFSAGILDLLDYTSTSKNKTIRLFTGSVFSQYRVKLLSGSYQSTSAITSITLRNPDAYNFVSGSRISLYGIKG